MKSDFSISHPWLGDHAGSERVFLELLKIFPESDLYCLWADQKKWKALIGDENFHFSYLNNIPKIPKIRINGNRNFLFLVSILAPNGINRKGTIVSKYLGPHPTKPCQ